MVTTIGNTNARVVISDTDDPATSTYALYIEPQMIRATNRLPWDQNMHANLPTGISMGIKTYIADIKYEFVRFYISSSTDWQNLLKALSYWEKNNNMLYLSVKNEWNENLAVWGSYDAPTSLTQLTGQLVDFYYMILPQAVDCTISFVRITKTSGA